MALLQTIPVWQAFAGALPLLYAGLRLAAAPSGAGNRPQRIPCSGETNSLFRAVEFPVPNYQGIRRQEPDSKPEKCLNPGSNRPEKIKRPPHRTDNREIPPPDATPTPAAAAPDAAARPAPPPYYPAYAVQARKLCCLGAQAPDIADFFEIDIATYQDWRRRHPDFAAAIAQGSRIADGQVELSLYRRAIGYHRKLQKVVTPAHAEEPIVVT